MEFERVERRKPEYRMTDDQFRQFTFQSLEVGDQRFNNINEKIDNYFKSMAVVLDENTKITKATADLAQKALDVAEKNAKDTEGLVTIYKLGVKTSDAVAKGTRWSSKTAKILIPLFVLGSIVAAIWHGEPIKIKEIIEALK